MGAIPLATFSTRWQAMLPHLLLALLGLKMGMDTMLRLQACVTSFFEVLWCPSMQDPQV